MSEYGRCQELAAKLAAELTAAGRPAVVINGWYRPETAVSSWHPAWQRLAARFGTEQGFIHYWVQCEGRILDPSATQFGGPSLQEAALDDPRYWPWRRPIPSAVTEMRYRFRARLMNACRRRAPGGSGQSG